MSKHTPGPWLVFERRIPVIPEIVAIVIGPSEDVSVCELRIQGRSGKTNGANARVLAAAPELLSALKLCESELFARCGDQPRAKRYIEQARAAIAKAEGETNG